MSELPIPPNSKHFREFKDGWTFELGCAGLRYYLKNIATYWRPIIAAVAEVAWLREEERISNIPEAWARKKYDSSPPEERERARARLEARQNARACRAWGKDVTKP